MRSSPNNFHIPLVNKKSMQKSPKVYSIDFNKYDYLPSQESDKIYDKLLTEPNSRYSSEKREKFAKCVKNKATHKPTPVKSKTKTESAKNVDSGCSKP